MSAVAPVKRRQFSISVRVNDYVSLDVSEVLEQLEDETLMQELQRRSANLPLASNTGDLDEVLLLLKRGDVEEAELLLDRLLHPKFKSFSACIEQIENTARAAKASQ